MPKPVAKAPQTVAEGRTTPVGNTRGPRYTASMSGSAPYFVVLDSNVWVAERLLQTSMASAVLFALTSSGALIGLPEVVEMEVGRVLEKQSEEAVEELRRNADLLRQLSGQRLAGLGAPTPEAVRDGIARRWGELSGLTRKVPFTHEQAKSALARVIARSPPCGPNNEQFRDCCIWETALELALDGDVHLVTNDSAFYEGRERTRGLAGPLLEESKQRQRTIRIYPTLRDLLAKMDRSIAVLDEATICEAIVAAMTPVAQKVANDPRSGVDEPGPASRPRINGYATPKASVIAISFSVLYPLIPVSPREGEERRSVATMELAGVCSYDPNRNEVSEIELREWSKFLDGNRHEFSSGTFWTEPGYLAREFDPKRTRRI